MYKANKPLNIIIMKSKALLFTLLLGGMVYFTSCKKPTDPPKSDEQIRTEELSGTWVLQSGANAVTLDGNDRSADWAGFTLTLGDKSYTTSSSASPEVWPASGTWEFGKNADNSVNVNVLVRNDGIEIQNAVTETSLTLQFTYTAPGGRLTGLEGDWVFKMVKQ